MARNKRFLGCQYPLVKGPRGLLAQKNGIDQIKADMLQLLLTNPGERVMEPEFGVPLRKLMFEPNDPTLEAEARKMIKDALDRYEPRVVIDQVFVTSNFSEDDLDALDPGDDREHILGVKILFFDPQNIQEVNELKLEVSIPGA